VGLSSSKREAIPPSRAASVDWIELLARLNAWSAELRHVLESCTKSQGISDAHFWLLWYCHHAEATGLDQSELANRTDSSHAQVSSLVEQLRQRDLMAGSRDPDDRRRQIWHTTPAGQAILEHIMERLNDQVGPCPGMIAQQILNQLPSITLREIRLHGGDS
jgi:DNA-binding MarR family transcriptional regulator